VTFESTMRWLVAGAIGLVLVLFAWTAFGQETSAMRKDKAPTASGTQAGSAAPAKATEASSAGAAGMTTTSLPKTDVETDASAPAAPAGPLEIPTINNWKDKVSYAFGVDLGRDLKRQKDAVNLDVLLKAMADVLADKPLALTDDEVAATLKRVGEEQKHDIEHAKLMIARKNREAGETFFAANAKKEGVVTLPSGLQYKIIKKGDGKTPTLDDKVTCKYTGTLLDGTEFDSSEGRGGKVTVPLKGLMSGWTQALQMMPVGSRWQLFLPPQLAYGDKVVNGVGPDATLIFEVELVSIEEKPQTVGAK
jgi:FKBP-type peptidyl-prolyl cis-trans isomerase FklB